MIYRCQSCGLLKSEGALSVNLPQCMCHWLKSNNQETLLSKSKHEWVDLTDEEVIEALEGISFSEMSAFNIAKIMASKLKEKNYDS